MKVRDLLGLAAHNLLASPLRSILCMLSVAVGTGALLLIAALGLFGQRQIGTALQTMGIGGLSVYLEERDGGAALSAALADDLADAVAGIDALMPVKAKTGSVRSGYEAVNAVFLGADERLGAVMRLEVLYGALFSAAQAAEAKPVVVVGDGLAQTFFGRTNIVGRRLRLRIGGRDGYYTVCGVVREQTAALGGALSALAPHLVYVPYGCLATRQENADQVLVQCAAQFEPDTVSEQITRYLYGYGQVGGTVRGQNISGMVDAVQDLTRMGAALFLAVGAVTLCVALIGVLCSMLSAAYEKTGEIGIFLALGAQPRDVRRLFLLQSVLLCLTGGVCGMAAAGTLLHWGAALLLPGWRLSAVLLGVTALCGAAAGWLPAQRAARLDPIDAMRK